MDPLYPTPVVEEPFSRIIIDCVGPLPKTKMFHKYICASAGFPEALPLRIILAERIAGTIIKSLTKVVLSKKIQIDKT